MPSRRSLIVRRLAARALDLAIAAYVFGFVVVEIRGRVFGGDLFATRPLAGARDPTELLVVTVVVVALVDVVPTARWGRTFGKLMLGLRVTRVEDDRAPGVIRATLRGLVIHGAVAVPLVGVGFAAVCGLSVVLAPSGRAVQDRLAGTVVHDVARHE